MSGETDVDAEMMMTGVEWIEKGEVESLESRGSPKSPKKLIINEEIQGREQEIGGVGSSLGEAFHH